MKRFFSLFAAALFAVMLVLPASAVTDEQYLFDDMELLDAAQGQSINGLLGQIELDYDVSMFIITTEEVKDTAIDSYCMNFCNEQGIDTAIESGIISIYDTELNMYYTFTYGEELLNDEVKQQIFDDFNVGAVSGNYYAAYQTIIDDVDFSLIDYFGARNDVYIIDDADILTTEEEYTLQSKIEKISTNYRADAIILTTNTTNGKTIEEFTIDLYDKSGFGYGDSSDGIMLVVDMTSRDYCICPGGACDNIFTSTVTDDIKSSLVISLSSEDYFTAFGDFLDSVSLYLGNAENGVTGSVSEEKDGVDYVVSEIIVIAVSLAIGAIIAFAVKSQMRTARSQTQADSYIKSGSFILTNQSDVYLYSNVTKTPKQTSNSGSGKGSSGGGHSNVTSGKF